MRMYSIKDKIAKQFGPPVLARNDEVATRQFVNLVVENKISSTDYALYFLADFNDEEGTLDQSKGPYEVVIVHKKTTDLTEVK